MKYLIQRQTAGVPDGKRGDILEVHELIDETQDLYIHRRFSRNPDEVLHATLKTWIDESPGWEIHESLTNH